MTSLQNNVILHYVDLGSPRSGVRVDFSPERRRFAEKIDLLEFNVEMMLVTVLLTKGARKLWQTLSP